jgi:hypothetical protein
LIAQDMCFMVDTVPQSSDWIAPSQDSIEMQATQPFLAHILPALQVSSIHLQAAVNLSSTFPLRLMAPTSKECKASQAT